MSVRAKFYVASVTLHCGSPKDAGMHEVVLRPVSGGSLENDRFFRFTPSGELRMGVVNPEVAAELAPGKTFYIDFTPAD